MNARSRGSAEAFEDAMIEPGLVDMSVHEQGAADRSPEVGIRPRRRPRVALEPLEVLDLQRAHPPRLLCALDHRSRVLPITGPPDPPRRRRRSRAASSRRTLDR
jgi:hypothetical protein